jgi:hypothetical protein
MVPARCYYHAHHPQSLAPCRGAKLRIYQCDCRDGPRHLARKEREVPGLRAYCYWYGRDGGIGVPGCAGSLDASENRRGKREGQRSACQGDKNAEDFNSRLLASMAGKVFGCLRDHRWRLRAEVGSEHNGRQNCLWDCRRPCGCGVFDVAFVPDLEAVSYDKGRTYSPSRRDAYLMDAIRSLSRHFAFHVNFQIVPGALFFPSKRLSTMFIEMEWRRHVDEGSCENALQIGRGHYIYFPGALQYH